ncbi:MAG: serine/threonine-protein kinase [Pseudomonadota bacterium]|nr:serine/threonine-protein kinase [Pseudomonadota bacterium]
MRPSCSHVIALEALPQGRAVACARCGQPLRDGHGVPLLAWCPGRAPLASSIGEETLGESAEGASAAPPPTLDRFRLLGVLGRGGAGVVYEAVDPTDGVRVALKVLLGGALASPEARARFAREAQAGAGLEGPGLVRVRGVGATAEGVAWIVMDLVEGPSLADVLADGRPLPEAVAVRIARDVARALAGMHARGLAHRDVKPANVLLTVAGDVRLADFGLVVAIEADARLTRTGQVVGTPAYMAPEQHAGARDVDWRRVDVYALGRVVAELAPPGAGDLARIAARATADHPADRYRDAGEVAADLQRILDGVRVRTGGARARQAARRHRGLLALALGTLLIAGVGIGSAALARRQRQEDRAAFEAATEVRLDQLLVETARADAAGDGAETLLRAFLDDPALARSRARAHAWAGRATQLAERGQDATEAWANAVVAARSPTDRAAALVGLVAALRTARAWGALERTLALLDAEHPGEAVPDRPAIEAELAAATGDLELLRARVPEDSELLAAVGPARLVLADGGIVAARTTPAGARDHLYVVLSNRDGVWPLDADRLHPALPRRAGPCVADDVLQPTADGMEAWRPDGVIACTNGFPAAAKVIVVDGEMFVATNGYDRRFSRRRLDGGPVRVADAGTQALASYLTDLLAADVDGDGRRELLVAVGPPFGFGVRLFDMGETLTLRSSARFGAAQAITVLGGGRLAVGTSEQSPSRNVFGDAAPTGVGAGIQVLREAGRTLTPVASIANPLPGGGRWSLPIGTSDLDGDGLPDLVVTHGGGGAHALGVYRGLPDGSFRGYVFEGWEAHALAQLDDDAPLEILANQSPRADGSRPLWILGLGDTPLPRVADAAPAAATDVAPDGEALVARLGLHAIAARALADRARLEPEGPARAALWVRAAGEWDAAGDGSASAAARLEAARSGAATPLASAITTWLADGRFDAARAAAAAVPGVSPPAWLDGLVAPTRTLTFDGALDPAWDLRLPALVRPNPHAGWLEVDTVRDGGVVLRLPLGLVAERVRARITFALVRQEWGGALVFGLGGESPLEVRFAAIGGGGHLFRHVGEALRNDEVAGPAVEEELELDVIAGPEGSWTTLSRVDPAGASSRGRTVELGHHHDPPRALGDGDWALTLSAGGSEGLAGALTRVRLRSIALYGLLPRAAPLDPPAPAPPIVVMRAQPPARVFTAATLALFRAAWRDAVTTHPDDPLVLAALRATPDPVSGSADARWLLAARGRAHWVDGELVAARADLERALRGVDPLDPELDDTCFDAHATLAEMALAVGDATGARARAAAAVACMPTDEVGRLRLRRWGRLAPLVPPER